MAGAWPIPSRSDPEINRQEFDQQVASMTADSAARLAPLRGAIRGVGGRPLAELNQLEEAIGMMPGFGSQGADKKAQLRADTSLPPGDRTQKADLSHEYHKTLILKHAEYGFAADKRLREELENGVLPKGVNKDDRDSVQREVELLMGDAKGQALVDRARAGLGRSPRHDEILLSSFGEAMFRGRGAEKAHATLRTEAVERYLKAQDGTTHQANSRKALLAYRQANTAGAIAAFRQAGLFGLSRDDK